MLRNYLLISLLLAPAGYTDANAPQPDGTTALHWAARSDDFETARKLIAAGADVKATNRYGLTPLTLAAQRGSARMLELLLNAGADPNTALPEGETALMTAARTGNPEAIQVLLSHGANVNAREKTMGETALIWAAAENHPEAVRVLLDAHADIDAPSTVLRLTPFQWVTSGMVSTMLPRGGWTALFYAARQGSLAAARVLAERSANLNFTDPDGATALVIAIINAHYDLANMLLEKGADPNIADETGMAALYAAVDMHTLGPIQGRPAPKMDDTLSGLDLIQSLLAHGANPNAQLRKPILGRLHGAGDANLGEGTTPLMRAAKANDIPVMKALLDRGADPFLTQKDYTTVLMIAAAGGAQAGGFAQALPVTEEGAIQAIQLCLDRGVDINAFNSSGLTALDLAAARGADKVVKYLAAHGAMLDLKNKAGFTALDLAMGKGGRRAPPAHESTAALIRSLLPAKREPDSPPPSKTVAFAVETNSKIWSGVYTTAQAARGRSNFERSCSNCHNSDLSGSVRGPALHGESFLKNWANTTANTLFIKLRDSMPATYPGSVPDTEKIDILAYLLEANGFPSGKTELPLNQKELETIPIAQKGEQAAPNFALVRLAGCLTRGNDHWSLTTPEAGVFDLLGAARFQPESHTGRKVEAHGLLYRDSGRNLLNLTSLETTGIACPN
jgi:ankyrin repeat protein